MNQDENDRIKATVEEAVMKVKLDQLDRSVGHVISTSRLGYSLLGLFFALSAIMVGILTTILSGMSSSIDHLGESYRQLDRSVSEATSVLSQLETNVSSLDASLGTTPDELAETAEKLQMITARLDEQAVHIQTAQTELSDFAQTVESLEADFILPTASWRKELSSIKSDVEALKRELVPAEKQTP